MKSIDRFVIVLDKSMAKASGLSSFLDIVVPGEDVYLLGDAGTKDEAETEAETWRKQCPNVRNAIRVLDLHTLGRRR